MTIPQVEIYLPELLTFVNGLAQDYEQGLLHDWPEMTVRVRAFFSPEMMRRMEAVIPGWGAMADQRDGVTLIHVISVLTALMLCPEYRVATPEQQTLAQWVVLFHDVSKEVQSGKRDCSHAFRSAAMAGRVLPQLGFASNGDGLDQWATLTASATTPPPQGGDRIQDNRRLPEIMAGIDRLFGRQTPAALILEAVLLHMSVDVVADWPQAAPLTDDEIRQVLDPQALPLLKIMMLVDNDAWAFFDPATKQRYRAETLDVFRRVQALVAGG